jgi:transketolase
MCMMERCIVAMFAVNNGIAAYGAGLWPFASTFLNFITYGWPAVRLGAMSNLRTLYVMTHDSIGLGEDGPTHQPIECLALLRATPNIDVYRPADGRETVGAYACIFGDRSANRSRPTVLCLSRQKLPQLTGSSVQGVKHGAYVLKAAAHLPLKAVIVATGSEVHIALEALSPCSLSDPLAESSSSAGTEDLLAHVQLVSMPSWTLFEEQPEEYRQSIFPAGVPVLSVEAGSTFGWSKFADASIGVDSFGASGPEKLVYEHFHLTAKHVREQILKLMSPTG